MLNTEPNDGEEIQKLSGEDSKTEEEKVLGIGEKGMLASINKLTESLEKTCRGSGRGTEEKGRDLYIGKEGGGEQKQGGERHSGGGFGGQRRTGRGSLRK